MYVFFLMFSVFMLLNLNYTILRSLRTTLAVVDLGSGAHTIPLFELLGALPGALLMTWSLSHLMRRLSIEKVFFITMASFLAFFLLFNTMIYPCLSSLKEIGGAWNILVTFCAMAFYALSELWKPALAVILFWGLINAYTSADAAKRLYSPLMLGSSVGAVLAGPIVSFCTSGLVNEWAHAFHLLMSAIAVVGMITTYLYFQLWKKLSQKQAYTIAKNDQTLSESIRLCVENKQLSLLSWIVIADYVSYSLGEVIFLHVLKLQYPNPTDYCSYMGRLSQWCGVLTIVSNIFITPYVLNNYRWMIASLVTPFCLLLTEGAFFIFLRGYSVRDYLFQWTEADWIGVVIVLGSIQYCLCRAAKYTLFDSSKELAFVLMPEYQRMKGKLVVDGLCARVGRGGASVLSMGLIALCGGVMASSFITGFIAMGMVASWLASTFKLGKTFDQSHVHTHG